MKKFFLQICVLLAGSLNVMLGQEVHWTLDPLNVTGSMEAKFGTASDDPLNFYTNNVKRLILDTNGTFKILSLQGVGRRLLYVDSSGRVCLRSDVSDGAGAGIGSQPCISSSGPWFEGGNNLGSNADNSAGTCNNYDFVLKANSVKNIWIKTNGKIGIGTSNPTAKLDVYEASVLGSNPGDSRLISSVRGEVGNGNNTQNNIWMMRSNGGSNDWVDSYVHDGISVDASFRTPGTDTRTWWQRYPHADIQQWGTATTTYMSLEQGKLFIGTHRIISSHPHANSFVQVDGKMACKELVIVDPTKWPDFVFSPDYKLRELGEVEKYYKGNKHLPDVPAEKEIRENGINAAEMDAILLQKIEELTLYVVELNKKVGSLEESNLKLRTELSKK